MVISAYNVEKLKGDSWTRMSEVLEGAYNAGFTPLLLLATSPEGFGNIPVIVPEVREKLENYVFFADRKTLVSMNRSNGGATWFNDGQLIQKFSRSTLPSDDDILAFTGDDPTEKMLTTSTKGRLHFQGFLLYLFAILLLL